LLNNTAVEHLERQYPDLSKLLRLVQAKQLRKGFEFLMKHRCIFRVMTDLQLPLSQPEKLVKLDSQVMICAREVIVDWARISSTKTYSNHRKAMPVADVMGAAQSTTLTQKYPALLELTADICTIIHNLSTRIYPASGSYGYAIKAVEDLALG
jgi:hypothetical protein